MGDYDAIVIGGGIAGLGIAGLMQGRGMKTLLLEKSSMSGGRAKTRELPGGWRLDSGIHCVDNGDKSACADLLKRIGVTFEWTRPMQGMGMYDGSKWLDAGQYFQFTEAETKQLRELEDSFAVMSDEEIDLLDRTSLSEFLLQRVKSDSIAEYMKTLGMTQSTLSIAEKISAGEFVSIYREGMKFGARYGSVGNIQMPLGGIGVMTAAMAKSAAQKGCEIKYSNPVKKIVVRKNGPAEIITDKAVYSARITVIAVPIWQLIDIIDVGDDKLQRDWYERIVSLRDETSATMGYTMGLRKPLFTEPVYLSAWRVPGVGLPLQILGHTNFDPTIAPPGHMIAFIGACCTPEQARDEKFRTQTLDKFWEAIKKMFPGFEEDVVWKVAAHYVGIDGLGRSPGLTGKYRLPVAMPGMKGLYFAGDCYTGRGVGMNAASNSAMICFDRIRSDFA
jgi:phytoene dehydrogenase-like protein